MNLQTLAKDLDGFFVSNKYLIILGLLTIDNPLEAEQSLRLCQKTSDLYLRLARKDKSPSCAFFKEEIPNRCPISRSIYFCYHGNTSLRYLSSLSS